MHIILHKGKKYFTKFLKLIVIIFIIINFLLSDYSYAFAYNKNTHDSIPNWVKGTFWGGVVILVGTWVWNTFLNDNRNDNKIDLFSNAIIYLLSGNDLSKYKNLKSDKERSIFIENYWKLHDPSPSTKQNELQEEYERRVNYSNQHYKEINRKGWQSDRGRALILYGEPMESRHDFLVTDLYTLPNQAGGFMNLEIWIYYKPAGHNKIPEKLLMVHPGGMFFVFAEFDGTGEYIQVYSTEQGENVDPRLYQE